MENGKQDIMEFLYGMAMSGDWPRRRSGGAESALRETDSDTAMSFGYARALNC
jgi:hypothetical protein